MFYFYILINLTMIMIILENKLYRQIIKFINLLELYQDFSIFLGLRSEFILYFSYIFLIFKIQFLKGTKIKIFFI